MWQWIECRPGPAQQVRTDPILHQRQQQGGRRDVAATTANLASGSTPIDGYGTPRTSSRSGSPRSSRPEIREDDNGARDRYRSRGRRYTERPLLQRNRAIRRPITIRGPGQFSRAGDSGALIVNTDKRPVGLLFAGTMNGYTFANQIGDVLTALRVSIDGT